MSLLKLVHLTQALVSTYTGLLSYTSIRKVQTYEAPTQKAAQYSNTAEHHLKTTQSTMAAGALSVLASLTVSTYLAAMSVSTAPEYAAAVSGVLGVGITMAHSHISNYWRVKMKVPLPKSGDYNDAITTSNRMRRMLGALAVSWGLVAVWYGVRWVS